jgi:hypothetical protein
LTAKSEAKHLCQPIFGPPHLDSRFFTFWHRRTTETKQAAWFHQPFQPSPEKGHQLHFGKVSQNGLLLALLGTLREEGRPAIDHTDKPSLATNSHVEHH